MILESELLACGIGNWNVITECFALKWRLWHEMDCYVLKPRVDESGSRVLEDRLAPTKGRVDLLTQFRLWPGLVWIFTWFSRVW